MMNIIKDAEILTDGETKESICIPSYSENGIVKKSRSDCRFIGRV